MQDQLPIWRIQPSILSVLMTGNRLVLVAPTGSGKTTQVPQMILNGQLDAGKKIVVLQPRRVAARTVAARVAWERNVKLGGEVGYQIRFEDWTSLGTRICFVTEGILLRWLQDDPALSEVGVILFDEFHERNLLSDVALALVKDLQGDRRPDLKVVVMSATLDAEPVAAYLDDCPILVSEGQSYPVEVRYLEHRDQRPVTEQAAEAVEAILKTGAAGDVLVFMPGMGEINSTMNALRSAHLPEKVALIPLHGDLTSEEQDAAFAPNPRRKIVVATNVAETSVTIDGIRHVVDSGLARVARYDAERGINTLFLEEISRASTDQRKGRAGRTAPGTCHRLWTESGHLNRPDRNTPEIQRSDLAEVVLLLHSLRVKKAAAFDWLDRPDPVAVERAEKLLLLLGALDESTGELTQMGRQMMRLPMHPRYSRMLVEASRHQCVPAAALCAALVSGRDLLMRLRREDQHVAEARELFEASQESDFYTLMLAFRFAQKNNFNVEQCRRYGIHAQTARQVEQTHDQIVQIARQQGLLPKSGPSDAEHVPPAAAAAPAPVTKGAQPVVKAADPLLKCLMAGFIDQLCVRRDKGTLECEMTGGRQGTLMRESVVQNASLLAVASIREVTGRGSENLTLLGLASVVEKAWIAELFPQHLTTTVEHLFDRTHKRVAAVKLVRFQDLVIEHAHLPADQFEPAASGRALGEAYLKGWFELPLFNHETKQFIARTNLVARVLPELEVPPFDAAAIVSALGRAFAGLTLVKEAQATHVLEAFHTQITRARLEWINELAPVSVPWHDGRKLKLTYPETPLDEPETVGPETQVKLHETFPLKEHPTVCEGKTPVVLWLAGPDGKRLESTTNWPQFKAQQYPKIRSALLKKYPLTQWP